jgi:protein-L-isoaspartate(D-aspartate) O-methyltransferase
MTQTLELKPTDRVLEIGVGSGYQTAVLSRLAAHVHGVEIVEPLARRAVATLRHLGVLKATIRTGDGHFGWPEAGPFDAILLACAPEQIPQNLVNQLKPGGRMILPMGHSASGQDLWLLKKFGNTISQSSILPVRFVPMTGDALNA